MLIAMEESGNVTALLRRVREGSADPSELLERVYAELRVLARARVARESDVITMGATGLLHEAWLRLCGDATPGFENRRHFFAAAAEAMRRILIERARAAHRLKRGAGATRITLREDGLASAPPAFDLLALDEALVKLEARDERMAQVVKLRYFGGLSIAEIATALDASPRTIDRAWQAARAWLQVQLQSDDAAEQK